MRGIISRHTDALGLLLISLIAAVINSTKVDMATLITAFPLLYVLGSVGVPAVIIVRKPKMRRSAVKVLKSWLWSCRLDAVRPFRVNQ